ncbi:hypothetical protein FRC11_001628, partial [Ceratobasidium sp. 423]
MRSLTTAEDIETPTYEALNEGNVSCSSLIAEGLDIKDEQERLKALAQSIGKCPSPGQTSLSIRNTKLSRNRPDQSNTQEHPERLSLLLPSEIPRPDVVDIVGVTVVEAEIVARHKRCGMLLSAFRAAAAQKAHVTLTKNSRHRSTQNNERAQATVNRRMQKLDGIVTQYNRHFNHLEALLKVLSRKSPFRWIEPEDVKEISAFYCKERPLGKGQHTAAWYWVADGKDGSRDLSLEDAVSDKYKEGIRLQWFESRERYRRWAEEKEWLQCDTLGFQMSLVHQHRLWSAKCAVEPGVAFKSYCKYQMNVVLDLLGDAMLRLKLIVEAVVTINSEYAGR